MSLPEDYSTNVNPSTRSKTEDGVPVAPYPPMVTTRFRSAQLLRSSLSNGPHHHPYHQQHHVPSIGSSGPTTILKTTLSASSIPNSSSITTTIQQQQPFAIGGGAILGDNDPSSVLRATRTEEMSGFSTRSRLTTPMVRFVQWDTLACINCMDEATISYAKSMEQQLQQPSTTTRITNISQNASRKQGPLLLELRRLSLKSNNSPFAAGSSSSSSLFETNTICQSRGNPSLGISVSSTCLDVRPSMNDRDLPLCATGLTTGSLCIHSFSPSSSWEDGEANVPSEGNGPFITSTLDYYSMPRNHRPATAVAWKISHHNSSSGSSHVAIGLTAGSTSVGGGVGTASSASELQRRSGAGGSLSVTGASATGRLLNNTGDREWYCCFLWDIEHQSAIQTQLSSSSSLSTPGTPRRTKTTPLFKMSHQAGVASLGWLHDGQTLVVGGQQRNLLFYDMRASTASPPVTAFAHNFEVNGIEVDPSRSWHFATFSRAVGEPVKLWDARRMDGPIVEIKVAGSSKITTRSDSVDSFGSATPRSSSIAAATATESVSAVKWSTIDAGRLSMLVGDWVQEYDTSVSGSRPVLANSFRTQKSILDFTHYPYPTVDEDTSFGVSAQDTDVITTKSKKVISELFPKRMVVVKDDHTIGDIATTRIAPIAVSRRSGQIIHGLGRTLWISSPTEGPTAMENPNVCSDEDISGTMLRRARCNEDVKYSMHIPSNIKLISREIRKLPKSSAQQLLTEQLLQLWKWIQRAEELCNDITEEEWDQGMVWPAKSLIDAGAWKLLKLDGRNEERQNFSESLSCATFDSEGRRAALTSCGWAGNLTLDCVMAECEENGEYERSAALAVWHGDIGAAVEALQRGADAYRSNQKKSSSARRKHAEILELVALSIAGYRGNDPNSASSGIWRKACASLLRRDELSKSASKSGGVIYLRHLLKFLMTIGIDNSHKEVLEDESLSLCDRVAFACHFLPRDDLMLFLDKCMNECQKTGNVEGMSITGIEKLGVKILQSYVDAYGDVQTACLITSRVVFPGDWQTERRVCGEWLHAYRTLLNFWQLWLSRAMFDVERADVLRKFKLRLSEGSSATTSIGKQSNRRLIPLLGRRTSQRVFDPDVQASVPAQLDARCNYCSASLCLRKQDGQANPWLSKMKNILSCCPQCRKPLPRCAICMLSLGALNPYAELTKARSMISNSSANIGSSNIGNLLNKPQTPDDLSSLANLPFAEWFTWCMRCKHGGHAHHMVGWFSTHEVCPVAGCDCTCQFDGIHRLKRKSNSTTKTPPVFFSEESPTATALDTAELPKDG